MATLNELENDLIVALGAEDPETRLKVRQLARKVYAEGWSCGYEAGAFDHASAPKAETADAPPKARRHRAKNGILPCATNGTPPQVETLLDPGLSLKANVAAIKRGHTMGPHAGPPVPVGAGVGDDGALDIDPKDMPF